MIKYINYKKFGKCLYYKNDQIHLMVTLDVGPRIIFLGKDLKNNILFEDIKGAFQMKTPALKKIFGAKAIWSIYGGHRLWTSPEAIYTYEPDDQKVKHKIINDHTFEFTTPISKIGLLQIIFRIEVQKNAIFLNHKVINHSKQTKTFAPWAITSLAPNGIATFRMNDNDTGFLPNRSLVLWPYTNLKDQRLSFQNHNVFIKMNPKIKQAFKIGTNSLKPQASYSLNKTQLTIETKYDPNGIYPDNGCSLEVYTNQHFLEIETLGKVVNLKSKQTAILNQKWVFESR